MISDPGSWDKDTGGSRKCCSTHPLLYSRTLHHDGKVVAITASLGGTVRQCPTTDIDRIIHEADLALYSSKVKGKNQCYVDVCRADESASVK